MAGGGETLAAGTEVEHDLIVNEGKIQVRGGGKSGLEERSDDQTTIPCVWYILAAGLLTQTLFTTTLCLPVSSPLSPISSPLSALPPQPELYISVNNEACICTVVMIDEEGSIMETDASIWTVNGSSEARLPISTMKNTAAKIQVSESWRELAAAASTVTAAASIVTTML
jgi:hypothetical protein